MVRDRETSDLGRKLRGHRLIRGWSLAELEQRTGIPKETLAVYERGVRFPSGKRILTLQRVLEVTADDLASGDDA